MLAKVSPVTYRIQCHAGAKPEVVHVDKLMPYQPNFGEELETWLRDEESGGCSTCPALCAYTRESDLIGLVHPPLPLIIIIIIIYKI